jgi:Protein of unknown function (DUF3175)
MDSGAAGTIWQWAGCCAAVMQAHAADGSFPMAARRTKKKTARKRAGARASGRKTTRRWSKTVTESSDAMTLDKGVFKKSPHAIALSLKRSAERSRRRKSTPFRSAMSMLTFYVNRAGKTLPAGQKKTLQHAKGELRKQFGRA